MPMIGGSPSAAGGRPTAEPRFSPNVYQPMMTTMVQRRADQKNRRGLGKNETNTGKAPSAGRIGVTCKKNRMNAGRFAVRIESQEIATAEKALHRKFYLPLQIALGYPQLSR
jgi:hypothetical protein